MIGAFRLAQRLVQAHPSCKLLLEFILQGIFARAALEGLAQLAWLFPDVIGELLNLEQIENLLRLDKPSLVNQQFSERPVGCRFPLQKGAREVVAQVTHTHAQGLKPVDGPLSEKDGHVRLVMRSKMIHQ